MTPRQIVTEIVDLERRRAEAVKAHQATLNALDARIDTIRRECEHALTRFHQRLGNDDSYHECELCGAELPAMPGKASGFAQGESGSPQKSPRHQNGQNAAGATPDALKEEAL